MKKQTGKVSRRKLLAQLSAYSVAGIAFDSRRSRASHAWPDQKDLGARVYNIADFGAVGDGTTLNTDAVQRAIDTCTKENGGTVLVPAGDFVIGTIELKSNIALNCREGPIAW